MQAERPTKLIDPVCGMTVDVAHMPSAGVVVGARSSKTRGRTPQGLKRPRLPGLKRPRLPGLSTTRRAMAMICP